MLCDADAEVMAGNVLWCFPNVMGHQLHGIAAIASEETIAFVGLGGRPVDDGNKVRSDDDSVLAFSLRVFRDDILLDDCHILWLMVSWGRGVG